MSLRHIAIPSWYTGKLPVFPSYELATRVQSKLQQDLLAWKASSANPHDEHGHKPRRQDAPPPYLLSFTPAPTYTLGRRQTEPLPPDELARLRAPLSIGIVKSPNKKERRKIKYSFGFNPEVLHVPRGGLTTYHGPGQVVLWPVIDLRSPLHENFTVRDYVCLLEKTTIATLKRVYDIEGFTTSDPGVWVRNRTEGEGEKKIAALGVHLRRHVTGLGVAINFGTRVTGPEYLNPWARIVACGLGDKGVTTVKKHLGTYACSWKHKEMSEDIASTWATEFATRLKVGNSTSSETLPLVSQDKWERWEEILQIDRASEGFVTAEEQYS
ncbi:hypothetical protein F5Y06DRAFT_135520 [Hypoxylon sp. FL0890]|nr:hypothetical protein F5Y06DRAFT_135520 [Hypoxylon sp. FL0890]